MKKRIRSAILAVTLVVICVLSLTCSGLTVTVKNQVQPDISPLEQRMLSAVALLYRMDESGKMHPTCTTMAYWRDDMDRNVCRVVAGSHCVGDTDSARQKVKLRSGEWFLLFEDDASKKFYPAKLIAAGYQPRGDDLAIFETNLEGLEIPTIPMSKDDGMVGESISFVGSGYGLGKQLNRGHISSPNVKRPLIEGDMNWSNMTLIQTDSGPGASGSSIVSNRRGEIVAILIGHYGSVIVAVPITRFHAFDRLVKAGKYHWFEPQEETTWSPNPEDITNSEDDIDSGVVTDAGVNENL